MRSFHRLPNHHRCFRFNCTVAVINSMIHLSSNVRLLTDHVYSFNTNELVTVEYESLCVPYHACPLSGFPMMKLFLAVVTHYRLLHAMDQRIMYNIFVAIVHH